MCPYRPRAPRGTLATITFRHGTLYPPVPPSALSSLPPRRADAENFRFPPAARYSPVAVLHCANSICICSEQRRSVADVAGRLFARHETAVYLFIGQHF